MTSDSRETSEKFMEMSDEPKSWVEEARNRVKRISDLDPQDRLDIVYGIGLCCSAPSQNIQGGVEWIGDLSLQEFAPPQDEEIFCILKKEKLPLFGLNNDKTQKKSQPHRFR